MAGPQIAYVLSLILFNLFAAEAQSPNNEDNSNSNSNNPGYFQSANFNPSMAIIIVVLISAFFFLGFFSIYLRQCGSGRIESIAATAAAAVGGRSRRQRGLDPSVLEALPALVYSEVKEHKIGKGALECAICLNEFDDEDALRLLPRCDHVFHQECIDAWLATHVTCPVCRTNYALVPDDPDAGSDTPAEAPEDLPASDPPPAATDQAAITVGDEERKQEMRELARIATRMRGNRSRRLPRSHSTGHSLQGDERERYTLRLPENVRKEIMAAGRLQRARSVAIEGSSRRGRSVRLGRSDRWPSFFARSLSARFPSWVNWRRADEGSSAKEGSVRASKYAAGGSFKQDSNVELEEGPAAALNRV